MKTPKPCQILAVIGEGFLPEGIKLFEGIEQFRESEINKNNFRINHIAGVIIDKYGNLAVCEMLENGCTITKWEDSRYFRNEVKFLVLDFIIPLTEEQKADMMVMARGDEGKPYYYLSIGWQIIFSICGWWFGNTNTLKSMFCSEQWAYYLNKLKSWFKRFWLTSPQMFFEDDIITIDGANFTFENMTK